MNRYKVDIIGLGNKGAVADAPGSGNMRKYLSYCHAVKDHPGFCISGLYDKDLEKVEAAQRIWGSCSGMPGDVVIIATPDEYHYEYLRACAGLDNPPKLVICEKPLCTKVEQAKEIHRLYRKKGIPLMVDYTRRFIPYWRDKQAEVIYAGEFLSGYCYYNRGAWHTLSHFIDLALWFGARFEDIQIKEIQPDYQWVFEWGLFYENDFYHEQAANKTQGEKPNSIYDNHLKYVMENAYNFLEGKEDLLCTGADGLFALVATNQIMERVGK